MREPKDIQKNFVPLFVLLLLADFFARVAQASGDDVWEHLAMLWTGPLDDIFFGFAGLQAFIYLLDPAGEKTIDDTGAHNHKMILNAFRTGGEEMLSVNFVSGSRVLLTLLPAALFCSLIAARFYSHPISKGAASFFQQHLAYAFPISLAVVLVFAVLRLGGLNHTYWKAAGLAGTSLFLAAFLDGRWQNHLYHMMANLENLLAWTVTFAWVGFIVAFTDKEGR